MGHRIYFMKQPLYEVAQGSAVTEEPFNMLTQSQWLRVLHHLNAHEVESHRGLRHRGTSARMLRYHTPRFLLKQAAFDYLAENGVIPSPEENVWVPSHIPQKERHTYERVADLWQVLERDYEMVNVSPKDRRVVWDLQRKAA